MESDRGREMVLPETGDIVDRGRVPEYLNEDFWAAFRIYQNWKRFGLPFAGGWAEQPAVVIDVLNCFLSEDKRRDENRSS